MNKQEQLDIVRQMIADGVVTQEQAAKYFPELAKSDDEKILKAIYQYLYNVRHNIGQLTPYTDEFDRWIAWLEKQGEQKPDEEYNITGIHSKHAEGKLGEMIKNLKSINEMKVKPKFKAGDWVVIDGEVLHIKEMTEDGYFIDEGGLIPFRNEKEVHIWTIQDAKDGDVLVEQNGEMPFIFKECKNNHIYCYCGYTNRKDIFFDRFVDSEGEELHWLNLYHEQAYPATKEQRDLLFQKMHEAGYEWDANKKELKKIEQNHANVFNIYEKSLLEKFKQAVYDCAWGKVTCKEEGETQEEYAERWSEQFLLMVRDWADEHQAEKDLKLTWEDIKEICDITFEETCSLQRNMKGSLIYKKQHYQIVLKRFNEERKEKCQ